MKKTNNTLPVLQALLVTFLWSTSFIIIKKGLTEIPPLTYAGLRYLLAALMFLPFMLKKQYRTELTGLNRQQVYKLILLGLVFYAFTQGAQFLGLSLLPSVAVSLLLNFTPMVVAAAGIFLLNEKPAPVQWAGSLCFIAGVCLYFYPVQMPAGEWNGLLVMFFGILANAGAAILGRDINRSRSISPLTVTFVSMSVGALILITIGLVLNGVPSLSFKMILWLLWLAGINTAFAFTLWNVTLRSLSAVQSSIINGTMLIQIGLLAWYFLGESISPQKGAAMLIAAAGIVMVQLKRNA